MSGKNTQKRNKRKVEPKPEGRPPVITQDVVRILEDCLKNGFTVKKSCEIAKIGRTAYYDKVNSDKEFADKMDSAQDFATEKARQNIVMAIQENDVATSKWWLERKAKDEFGTRTELTGKDGKDLISEINVNIIDFSDES